MYMKYSVIVCSTYLCMYMFRNEFSHFIVLLCLIHSSVSVYVNRLD